MNFLGIAFEMSAIDVGLEDGIDKATSGLDSVNDMMERQVEIIKTLKSEDVASELDKQALSAEKAARAISREKAAFDNMSDGALAFAVKADDILNGFENGFKNATAATSKWWEEQWDDSFKIFKKFGKGVGQVGKDIKGTCISVIEPRLESMKSRLNELSQPVISFGKKTKKVFGGMGGIIKKGIGGVDKMFDGLKSRVDSFNLANISSKTKDLTGETGDLSNGLESTFASMAQTTKPVVAALNLTSKEMKKMNGQAAGIAYGLNIGADQVVNTLASIEVASDGAKKAIDEMSASKKDWARIVETTGVPMSEYTSILGTMTDEFQLAPKRAGKMLDALVEIGKKTGTGLLPLKGASGYLGAIEEKFKSLPPHMKRSGKDIEGLILSTAKFSGVMVKLGKAPEKAMEAAQEAGNMFAAQSVMVEKAMTVGGERGNANTPMMNALIQVGMNFDEARETMNVGSKDVTAGMAMIQKAMDANPKKSAYGIEALKEALGETSPILAFLTDNTESAAAAIAEMGAMSIEGTSDLKKFGKEAHSPGLTLQDTFNRAQEAFDTTMRSISRGRVGELVKNQMAGMREAGRDLKELGAQNGPIGSAVRMMSQYQQMGLGGVFAEIAESTGIGAKNASKMGAKMGVVLDTVGKIGGDISPFMEMLGMFGPGGVLVGGLGIATLFMLDPKERKEILGDYSDLFEDAFDVAGELIAGIDFEAWWPKIRKFGIQMFDTFQKLWSKMIDAGVIKDIGDGLKAAWRWFTGAVNWETVVYGIAGAFKDGFNAFVGIVKWDELITGASNAFDSALDWAVTNLPFDEIGTRMGEVFTKLLPVVWKMLKAAWTKVGEELGVGGQLALGAVIAGRIGGGGILGALANGIGALASGPAGKLGVSLGSKILSTLHGGSIAGTFGLVGLAALMGVEVGNQIWKTWKERKSGIAKDERKHDSKMGKWATNAVTGESGRWNRAISNKKKSGTLQGEVAAGMHGTVDDWKFQQKDIRTPTVKSAGWSKISAQWKEYQDALGDSSGHYIDIVDMVGDVADRYQESHEIQKQYLAALDKIDKANASGDEAGVEKGVNQVVNIMRGLNDSYGGEGGTQNWLKDIKDQRSYRKTMQNEFSATGSVSLDTSGAGNFEGPKSVWDGSATSSGGGKSTGDAWGEGFKKSMEPGGLGLEGIDKGMQSAKERVGGSLPEAGPLANGTAAFDGGYQTMVSFAKGIESSTDIVRKAVEETMDDAVILTMREYATQMKQVVEEKNILEQLAHKMVQNLGGKIETEVNSKNDVNVEKNFKAAMSLPGFSGMILAVSNEGAQTRKMLAKILAENEKQTLLMQGEGGGIKAKAGAI